MAENLERKKQNLEFFSQTDTIKLYIYIDILKDRILRSQKLASETGFHPA